MHPLDLILIALLIVASVIDVRERRLPNPLAAVICAVSVARCLAQGGVDLLVSHMLAAAAICTALVFLEVAWRSRAAGTGIGMGDIKLAFALMIWDPTAGCLSLVGGLCALAIWAIATRVRTLPLIPYLALIQIALIMCDADGSRLISLR